MKYKTKIAALLLFFSVSSLCAEGAEKQRSYTRFTFGVESSYVLTFLNYSHFNFISADGDRRDERYTTMNVFNNGQILLHAGVNMSENLNLSLYAGYSGVYRHERMIPLSLRLSWYSGKDPMADRWILFCSAGTGFNDFEVPVRLSAEGRLGGGYRISLNRAAKLDFLVAWQGTYTHPSAYESDAGDYVPPERLRRNDALFGAVTFGIALVF